MISPLQKKDKNSTPDIQAPLSKWYYISLVLGITGVLFPILLLNKFYSLEFPIPYPRQWWIAERIVVYKAGFLAVFGLIVTLFFFRKILKLRDPLDSFRYGVITFLVGLFFYLSIYIVAPSYTFQQYPRLFMYTSLDGTTIIHPQYYFWLLDRFGFTQLNADSYRSIEKLDDAIAGLEYAKSKDNPILYAYIFKDLEKFGYDKVLEKYDDVTFQLKLLGYLLDVNYGRGEYNYEIESGEKFIKIKIAEIKKLHDVSKEEKILTESQNILDIYSQYEQSKIDRQTFFSQVRNINLGLFEATQGIQNVQYHIIN